MAKRLRLRSMSVRLTEHEYGIFQLLAEEHGISSPGKFVALMLHERGLIQALMDEVEGRERERIRALRSRTRGEPH